MSACRHCGAPLPSGLRLCPDCGRMQEVLNGAIEDWRSEYLASLQRLRAQGATHVRWVCADDPALCARCAKRRAKVFTIEEAQAEVEGPFCEMDPYQGRCRCLFEHEPALV